MSSIRRRAICLFFLILLVPLTLSIIACENGGGNTQGTATPTPVCVLVADANGTHEEGNCPQP